VVERQTDSSGEKNPPPFGAAGRIVSDTVSVPVRRGVIGGKQEGGREGHAGEEEFVHRMFSFGRVMQGVELNAFYQTTKPGMWIV
jgi:hypothetical protein